MRQVIIALILAALALVAAWFIFNPHPDNEPLGLPEGVATTTSGWKVYTNADFGFEMKVPASFSAEDSYFYYGLGPGREIPGIAFRLPAEMVSGTNLSANSGISVEQLSRAACTASDFLPVTFAGTPIEAGGYTYLTATSSDAGAGNFYEETVFATKHRGFCYGVRYLVHSTNIGNYEPGTVAPFHRESLLSIFDTILGTIRFI